MVVCVCVCVCVCVVCVCVCVWCVCVCVCGVCVCVCVRVYVVYEDTNLYNDMGMTEVLQFEGVYEDTAYVPVIQNAYKSYRVRFFWGK